MPWSVPAGYGAPYGAPPATSTNQLCLVSMITGIAGVASAFCCALFGIPLGIAAIATGIIGMTQVGSGDRGQGRGMAIAGICCGAAAVVVPILFAVLFTLPSYTGLQ